MVAALAVAFSCRWMQAFAFDPSAKLPGWSRGSSALDRNTAVNLCIRGRRVAILRGIESRAPPTPFKRRARVAHGAPPCGVSHSCLDVRGLISVYALTMLPEET